MPRNKKTTDALPQSFKTIDEFIEFWDTHSTADYPEAFREIHEPIRLRKRRYYRVTLNARVGEELAQRARTKGVTLDKMVNQVLQEHLRRAA